MKRFFALFKHRYRIGIPRRKQIVIYPEGKSTEILLTYLDAKKTSVFSPFGNEINVLVLLRMLVGGRVSRFDYLVSYLKCTKPTLVITTSDNDINFYRLKSIFPEMKTVAIQNGVRGNASTQPNESFFDLLKAESSSAKLSADFVCTFGTAVQQEYRKHIDGQFIAIGNLRNNFYNNALVKEEVDLLVYISGLSGYPKDSRKTFYFFRDTAISYKDFYAAELHACSLLIDYCKRNNLRIVICGKQNSTDTEERRFYTDRLGSETPAIQSRDKTFDSYELLSKARLIVSLDSTVAYEFMSRGKRSAFVGARLNGLLSDNLLATSGCTFGFPADLPKSGSFWSSMLTQSEIDRILNYARRATDKEWTETVAPITELLMAYDPGNTKLQKLICELTN